MREIPTSGNRINMSSSLGGQFLNVSTPGRKRWAGSKCFGLKDLAPSHPVIHIQHPVTCFVPGNESAQNQDWWTVLCLEREIVKEWVIQCDRFCNRAGRQN